MFLALNQLSSVSKVPQERNDMNSRTSCCSLQRPYLMVRQGEVGLPDYVHGRGQGACELRVQNDLQEETRQTPRFVMLPRSLLAGPLSFLLTASRDEPCIRFGNKIERINDLQYRQLSSVRGFM
jgi:hypothetical protein